MVTILCSGSRGDVQPYVALAVELGRLGVDARLVVTRDFAEFVSSHGVKVVAVDIDMTSAGVDPGLIRRARKADNPVKMFFSFRELRRHVEQMMHEYYGACSGSSVIVYHPGMAIGYFAGLELGIPSALASPFPLHATKEWPSVALYGRIPSVGALNRLSYRFLQGLLWSASRSSVRHVLRSEHRAIPPDFGAPFERSLDADHPAIISCSNHVFPRPSDWNPNIHQNGYWFLDEPEGFEPPPHLEDFLSRGNRPVYVGFGTALDDGEADRIFSLVAKALQIAGVRGIVSGMGDGMAPDHVCRTNAIPHAWLFRYVAAACHHGGAGTTAAGFRAGVPSIIVPSGNDQHAWAQRAYDLGVGARPLRMKQLTENRLADAFTEALQPRIVENARALGDAINQERGAEASARVIANLLRA